MGFRQPCQIDVRKPLTDTPVREVSAGGSARPTTPQLPRSGRKRAA
jgi:hypothetical protein